MADKDKQHSLVVKFAERYGILPEKLITTLLATAFRQRDGQQPTLEQLVALLVVADQYNLNPFTKEIYAYPDKQNGIIPVVSVDGWTRIANEHPQFDGADFRFSEEMYEPQAGIRLHAWMEAVIHRKDREHPIVVREYAEEVYRLPLLVKRKDGPGSYEVKTPWQSHPKRMHRHKTWIQGLRYAFGFAGIYDQDEAERIMERDIAPDAEVVTEPQPQQKTRGTAAVKEKLMKQLAPTPASEAPPVVEPAKEAVPA